MLGVGQSALMKTAAPATGNQLYTSQPTQPWGAGMLAPPGGYNMAPNTPERAGMQASLDFFTGLAGPQMAQLQQQAGMYQGQLGTTQAGYDMAKQAAQAGADAQIAKINLGPEYDAISRAANNRQIAGLDAQDKLAWEALGNQFEGFDLRNLQAWQAAQRGQWANRSDATGKGSVGSVGYNRRMGSIQEDLANQITGIGIDKDSAVFAARDAAMGRTEQKAKLNDQNAMLDIKAKEYGIDKQQVQANLQQGLAKLGIDNVASVNQIMDMLASNDVQQRALGEQIFRDAMGNSDFFTTLPQNTTPTGSIGGASGNNPVAGKAVDEYMTRGATAR